MRDARYTFSKTGGDLSDNSEDTRSQNVPQVRHELPLYPISASSPLLSVLPMPLKLQRHRVCAMLPECAWSILSFVLCMFHPPLRTHKIGEPVEHAFSLCNPLHSSAACYDTRLMIKWHSLAPRFLLDLTVLNTT